MDEEEEGSVGEDDDEEIVRRRFVFRFKGGKMVLLKDGVDEFERVMEKRVKKMLD